MEITKRFEIALPPETVWAGLSDIRLVAACLPGASIGEELPGGGYQGKMAVKLGPISVSFNGEMNIERNDADKVAVVKGKGVDSRSGTRVQATMTYSVKDAAAKASTAVEIVSEIALSGAMAQFGKSAVVQEVAGHMAMEFARNFTARLIAAERGAGHAAPAPSDAGLTAAAPAADAQRAPEQRNELSVVALAGKILWARIKALLGLGKNKTKAG